MLKNSTYRSEFVENEWSDNHFRSVELSEECHLAEESSSCRFLRDNSTGNRAKEQQHIVIQRKRILRPKGSCKIKETSRSNTTSPTSSIILGELAENTSDSYSHTGSSHSDSIKNLAKSAMDTELENDDMFLEILGKGSKLMKSIKLPTVITRTKNLSLQHSMVYYVTLEADSEDFVGQMPALMFSSHYCSGKTTDLAELLPLLVTRSEWSELLCLGPMLRRGCYKRLLRKGCNFKIIALAGIRVVDWSLECPWKLWDLNIKEMQKVVIDVIYEDIRRIPKNILQALKPLKCDQTFKKSRSLSVKQVSRSSEISSKETEFSESLMENKLSDFCSDLEFTGLVAQGGSKFAEWFKTIPPNVRVDQNFKCKWGTIFTKDNFSDLEMLEKYLGISEKV